MKTQKAETGMENMSQKQLARYLGLTPPTLRRTLAEEGCDLPYRRFGRRLVFSKRAVDRWLARQDESGAS